MELWKAPVANLVQSMRNAGLARAFIVSEPDQEIRESHPVLSDVAQALRSDSRDFHGHEACFFEIGLESGHLLGAFIHRTRRGQGAGGLRNWFYPTFEAFVRDGLRLSRGMGQKNALAGLWWGGGKGIVARQPNTDYRDPNIRRRIYRDYGRFVTGLKGCYITAEDVGTTPADMEHVFHTTRHATCIPPRFGGSGNPSGLTAKGVVVAMEAALQRSGLGDLGGKTIAVQGLGNVASFMIEELLARGVARVVASDIFKSAVETAVERFGDSRVEARVTEAADLSILAEKCDILAPCAIGAVLNPATIPTIQAPIVCGAANNQLEDPARDADLLHERAILYVPDFLANRMGIVNCANEQYGVFEGDPVIQAHLDRETPWGVFQRSLEVFERATVSGRTPAAEAELLADELSEELHPIWGHRGFQIVRHLVEQGWHHQPALKP